MQYDYNSLKKRTEIFKDELMRVIFNHERVEYFMYKYNYNLYREEFAERVDSEEYNEFDSYREIE